MQTARQLQYGKPIEIGVLRLHKFLNGGILKLEIGGNVMTDGENPFVL